MKYLFFTALLLTFSLSAFSQTEVVRFHAICLPINGIAEVVEKFKEEPSLVMTSNRQIEEKELGFKTVMFINYKTKTWTLVEQVGKDKFCVTATGEDIKPLK
jgi:hypothetical protein